jgi:ribulose-5-phosphate 4-epimerase/fuculose-1-phosphate aldolase
MSFKDYKQLTEQERDEEIKKLQSHKIQLLSEHGVFGGGERVNRLFENINRQLEKLGQTEYELIPYAEWIAQL